MGPKTKLGVKEKKLFIQGIEYVEDDHSSVDVSWDEESYRDEEVYRDEESYRDEEVYEEEVYDD